MWVDCRYKCGYETCFIGSSSLPGIKKEMQKACSSVQDQGCSVMALQVAFILMASHKYYYFLNLIIIVHTIITISVFVIGIIL